VSIVNVQLALARSGQAEVARIPVIRPADPDGTVRPGNPKGTAITSDGRYAVVSGGPDRRGEDILEPVIPRDRDRESTVVDRETILVEDSHPLEEVVMRATAYAR